MRRRGRLEWVLWLSVVGCASHGAPADGRGGGGGPTTGTRPDAGGGTPAATETCGNGLDDDGRGGPDDGCPCARGTTQPCFEGPPTRAGVGACTFGVQSCASGEEFATWGACTGSGTAAAERCDDGVDNDCDDAMDCGDADCPPDACAAPTPAGEITIRGFSYCTKDDGMYSAPASGFVTDCGARWSDGGTLTTDRAGTFTVCGRMISERSGRECTSSCLEVVVPEAGVATSFGSLPGFTVADDCGVEARDYGGTSCGTLSGPGFALDLGCTARFCGYHNLGPACRRGEDLVATF